MLSGKLHSRIFLPLIKERDTAGQQAQSNKHWREQQATSNKQQATSMGEEELKQRRQQQKDLSCDNAKIGHSWAP